MGGKAAVVIGVNRTGGLDPLQGAARAASDVEGWLKGEGFEVELLTDERRPVHAADVQDALAKFVTYPPRYKLLVVYFSGHGYWHARADRWLLSGAPVRGSDAINLGGAMDLARYSGIETVVFFSDACRSIPQTAEGQRVEGVDGFPNVYDFDRPSKVDSFKATGDAQSAYEFELRPGEPVSCRSVLTTAWLAAYEEASADMVVQVEEDGRRVFVVPNRRLEDFLQRKVDELLSTRNDPTLTQYLDINVPSADHVYVGCAKREPSPVRGPVGQPRPTLGQAAAAAVERILDSDSGVMTVPGPLVRDLIPAPAVHFGSGCGFVVTGGSLSRVATTGEHGAGIELLNPRSARLWGDAPATSVVGQLDDGRCFVVPALREYIGHVAVSASGVANVAYVPRAGTQRYREYERRHEEIDALRALVAISIDHNTLVVRDQQKALELAERIRIQKRLDPSLGLYAAHAYSSAGMDEEVQSVMRYMRADLDVAFFDVAMLASRRERPRIPTVPFCPVLTQAWSLLRPRGWRLDPALEALKPALLDSLWTTFAPDAAETLFDVVEHAVMP